MVKRKQTIQQIGNYLVDHELGRGATSEVWLAHHAYLEHRFVAVKLLLSQDIETIQRFSSEANLLGRLQHPNIVQIYDHGLYDPYYYSILEYIQGNSLQALMDRMGKLHFADALGIFKQIAAALDYAHMQSIIHRDVSPGNVLVEEMTGRALLSDFGIAHDPQQNLTVNQRVMGTPGFWSPEHARSAKEVTNLSDIYSLGVILYVMLSGSLPWDTIPGPHNRVFEPPLPLKQRGVHTIPDEVDRVIRTMLATDPTKRFPSAQASVDELERIMQHHHATTQVYDMNQTASSQPASPLSQQSGATLQSGLPITGGFYARGVSPNAVEMVLGEHLIRTPIAQAHERAQALCQPDTIAALLNTWSKQGFRNGFFRRPMLGRLARLHRISSHNIYFYKLHVLYEQRGQPQTIEEPDYSARSFPLELEVNHWQVPLAPVQSFEDDAGDQVILPGSSRVVSCEQCDGKGKTVCPRCNGRQRITVTRTLPAQPLDKPEDNPDSTSPLQMRSASRRKQPANADLPMPTPSDTTTKASARPRTEQVVVPCPECEGRGGLPCKRCDAMGRLIQRKAFRWQRAARMLETHDDLSFTDATWLLRTCAIKEVYCERCIGDVRGTEQALYPEWSDIPGVQSLLEQAVEATGDETRILMSELTIGMLPVTEVTFDLGDAPKPNLKDKDQQTTAEQHKQDHLYTISICGFENVLPIDWRFLNWERVIFFWGSVFLLILVAVLGYFAFL